MLFRSVSQSRYLDPLPPITRLEPVIQKPNGRIELQPIRSDLSLKRNSQDQAVICYQFAQSILPAS